MIDQKKIRELLRKTENKFISDKKTSKILNVDKKTALQILTYLNEAGYIEKAVINGFWQQSLKGKILANKKLTKEFRVYTLKKQLDNLKKRLKIINSSNAYPDYINCAIITSEYPIANRGGGINIVYSLASKGFSEKERDMAENEIRKQYKGNFSNIVEYIFYPNTAIRLFLKSRSPVLKLREYSKDEITNVVGHSITIE